MLDVKELLWRNTDIATSDTTPLLLLLNFEKNKLKNQCNKSRTFFGSSELTRKERKIILILF